MAAAAAAAADAGDVAVPSEVLKITNAFYCWLKQTSSSTKVCCNSL